MPGLLRRTVAVLAAICCAVLPARVASQSSPQPAQHVAIFAAGSLAGPLNAIAAAVARDYGIAVTLTLGPSGTLRERLEKGEPADLFASANMEHPLALTGARLSGPAVLFTRNTICAFTRADVGATSDTLLARMLDPKIALATSTPVADPAGDYAWLMFRKADSLKPGAYATLDAKALKLSGGPTSTPPPPSVPKGRNATAFYLETHVADVSLQYCSGSAALTRDSPSAIVVSLPSALTVGADYGMTMMKNATPSTAIVFAYILSASGQQVFVEAGFQPVNTPLVDGPR